MTKVELSDKTKDIFRVLYGMDRSNFRPRDFTVLASIARRPGTASNAICPMVGVPMRSMIREPLERLEAHGLIEDRRINKQKAVMTVLHITEKGQQLLDNPEKVYEILNDPDDL
jgi:DNA-binding MarR family transcriptional regulator